MDGEISVSGGDVVTVDDYMDSSFWIDACEDLSCSTIDDFDFANFGTVNSVSGLSPHNRTVDYGGIEHFLDTMGCVNENSTSGYFDFSQSVGSAVSECQHDAIHDTEFQDSTFMESTAVKKSDTPLNVAKTPVKCKSENGFVSGDDQNGFNIARNVEFNCSSEIVNKRARLESQNRRQQDINVRKRVFEGDHDYRNRENKRIRMNHFSGRMGGRKNVSYRDGNITEGKGYWQRDSLGKDLIFRCGSYKADCVNPRNSISEKTQVDDLDERDEPKENILVDKARQYQLDVLEHAKAKNTIAFLETGAGKTLIAVLLIKSVSDRLLEEKKKMLAVFLVPKVPLVYQQAEVIREQTSFHVGHYCGDMGHNFWDSRKWKQEFESKQVLVMTAQILLNILRHSIIKMESISIIILDECHHAVKKHPYSLVMSEFYHTITKAKRPSIFGMTASPVNLKGVSSQVDCAIKIRNLETKLDSTVFTIKDRRELEQHVHMPSEVIIEYDKAASQFSLHKQIKNIELEVVEAAKSSSRRSKWQFMGARDAGAKELHRFYGVSARTEGDGAANLIQKFRAICYTLSELGQWCAYKMAQTFLSVLQNNQRANYQIDVMFQETYLKRVVCLLQCELSEGAVSEKNDRHTNVVNTTSDNVHSTDATKEGEHTTTDIEEGEIPDSCVDSGGEHVDSIIGAAVADGIVTPKVQSLIKLLLQYKHTKDFRAIIFVERVAAALVLPKVFSELPSLSFIRCASLIGHSNSLEMRTCKMQDTINKFRDARITTLVTTSVAEEGLDIRQCNVVIRFDLAKTVLAYVQSRGRARKPGSAYILMVERGNVSHSEFLFNARNSEETIRKEATDRTDISHVKGISKLISLDVTRGAFYQVESTGAMVSLNSAVGLIHLYCTQLPSDRFSILRPDFIMESHEMPGGSVHYSCKLYLPCNAAFDKLEGPVCASLRLAQQVVCLDACKKLHEMGAFTDMLLPDKGNGDNEEKIGHNDQEEPLLGAARHREFYPEGVASDLKGEWLLLRKDDCGSSELFHLYIYLIKCENIGSCKDKFFIDASDFAILFGKKLDPEVLSVSVDLFIARDMTTKATLEFRGSMDITFDQLTYLKSFHVRLMSIVLDVDVDPLNTPWDAAKAYLFVPLVENHSPDPMKELDWALVNKVFTTDAWKSALHRARPDVYFGTKERALGGDRREYGFAKLRHGMIFGQSAHPTYGIRGAIAQFDVVKATGLVPVWDHAIDSALGKLILADSYCSADELVGKIITAAHSGKRFFVDSVCLEMNAENSFPRKESYLGPLEYSSYSEYYRQKYGVELFYKQQPLIKARGVSYCKNLLSPRFQQCQGESEDAFDKIYYVYLPPELCVVHPLSAPLIRGAQRLPSIMKRVESMLLAIELKKVINYPISALKILEALTAASCQEPFCYERAELLGDAYLKWVVSRFLFLNYPGKHEGQLTRMRQKMVSNVALYLFALRKGLQSYILADRFSPSRWAAPGVLPVFDEDAEAETFLFDDKEPTATETVKEGDKVYDGYEYIGVEEGEIEGDSSSYRVLSSKTLADVVEALIGVYYIEGGKSAAKHLMEWLGFDIKFIPEDMTWCIARSVPKISESLLRSVDFESLRAILNVEFKDVSLLLEAITHASCPSYGVSCYQRLEFMGDAVLDHLITKHLFFSYTDLPPGQLTDLRAAAVNNENFARVAVKHKLHLHLRHGSSSLENQIHEFVKEFGKDSTNLNINSFGLGDCKAPKVLGDIIESIAGALFIDNDFDTSTVWKVFRPLLEPIVTPDTLGIHPVRELQELCQHQAEGLEYKSSRSGNMATVEVYVDGVQIGVAQNRQKKMAQKLAARNALSLIKDKQVGEPEGRRKGKDKNNNGCQTFTRQTLNDLCLRRNWPMPLYRCVNEGGPAHARRFTYAVRVNTAEWGWTDECVGEPMPNVKKAKDSASLLLLDLIGQKKHVK